MTKPLTITPEVYDEVRKDRDYWKRECHRMKLAAQAAADELAEHRRQSHQQANRAAWGGALNGRW